MILSPVYHWSPIDRREAILSEGLKPYAPANVQSGDLRWPYLCFSPSPSAAWALSGDMDWVADVLAWDLWQVTLIDGDEVHVRPDFGPRIQEIKVYGSIPMDRLWHVATRECPVAQCKHGAKSAADCPGSCFPDLS